MRATSFKSFGSFSDLVLSFDPSTCSYVVDKQQEVHGTNHRSQ
jgi:hypothetical protein